MRGMCGRTREEVFAPTASIPTGDLGSLDADGYLWYGGRRDDMFKVKGATVFPAEVEAALRAVDGGAAGVRHRRAGERVSRARPRWAPSSSRQRRSSDVAEAVRARLSAFKVPTIWLLGDAERRADDGDRQGGQDSTPGAAAK